MIRTYLDSGVLLSASRETDAWSDRALEVLEDENRTFACSLFVRLEVLPKAICYRRTNEAEFYREYFEAVQFWANDVDKLLEDGYQIACKYGLAAIDALHVAAALAVEADELVTTERSTKPMHRVSEIRVISVVV
ncbi:PIN domain-containing protein [Pseudanabaenaceae cyanobacterium LEGE 13415]|nr:PIN domain-containing protein [Pseudanabaenaceae cyanobacterium LEGE 13415]